MLQPPTILIADDSADDVFFVQSQLRAARVANPVQTLSNGEEAIRYLGGEGRYGERERFPFPILLLLDLRMPRKTGWEVLQWMNEQHLVVPTLVLSAVGEVHQMSRAFQLGARSFLIKPLGMRQLNNALRKIQELTLVEKGDEVWLRPARRDRAGEVCPAAMMTPADSIEGASPARGASLVTPASRR